MTCETDSKISLMPLNAEGKPIDLDETNAASVDGDTSESYGSCEFSPWFHSKTLVFSRIFFYICGLRNKEPIFGKSCL